MLTLPSLLPSLCRTAATITLPPSTTSCSNASRSIEAPSPRPGPPLRLPDSPRSEAQTSAVWR